MINNVVLMGRITATPEMKKTQSGKEVTTFCIAVDRFKKGDTDFINVVAWGKTSEFICKYFKKGQMIAINGRIETRKYQDKSGNSRTAFEIIAENVSFCGDNRKNDESTSEETNALKVEYEDDDGLPF